MLSGEAGRHTYNHPNDDLIQAGELYRKVMSKEDRDHLIGNIVTHLSGAQKRIQLRQTSLFYMVDEEYGQRVAEGLKLDLKKVESLAAIFFLNDAAATEK